jgi:hypothetical protein
VQTVRAVDDRLNYSVYDLAAVHRDSNFVADFVGFGRHETSLANEGVGATVRGAFLEDGNH